MSVFQELMDLQERQVSLVQEDSKERQDFQELKELLDNLVCQATLDLLDNQDLQVNLDLQANLEVLEDREVKETEEALVNKEELERLVLLDKQDNPDSQVKLV